MHLKIKYFGVIAEEAGVAEETLQLDPVDWTVESLRAYCFAARNLREDSAIRVAVNQQLRQSGPLQPGDEVAFLPPFAGG
ncbi:MAG: MoaD/ThiS family protein [Bacteroidetes bacterium]|nr:MAG: MoaD/ThiS family protein [Bacteroidota bacterium]